MKIGYVCTNYNNTQFTRAAVASLAKNNDHEYHIVIVDNNSTPDSITALHRLKDEFPDITIIFNPENSGYFTGLNIGINHLRSHHSDINYMVVGNNDLTFRTDFLQSIARHKALFQTYPVVSPDVITVDGIHQNPHVINGISKFRELMYDLYYSNYYLGRCIKWAASLTQRMSDRRDEEQWETGQVVNQGHGSCYILGPLFFEKLQLLWAPTFLMGEEYFLSKQINDAGMSIYYEPGIQVTHHWHATIEQLPSRAVWEMARKSHKTYREYVKIF